MSGRAYLGWFLGVVVTAVVAMVAFNAFADAYLLSTPKGKSLQTVSGFERVLKPAWLDSIKPDTVFAGSSRMREGFDPTLLDPALHLHSFDYGLSSISPYEARRLIQDSAAQPSVRAIFVSMDAFASTAAVARAGSGFDELRLAVTASGQPTPRRSLWLFTTRYLSGGALGMHALSLYLLAQLKSGQPASDRPDLFTAYSRMTQTGFRKDLAFRYGRQMAWSAPARREFNLALDALCNTGVRAYLFFPPDHFAMIARYMANNADGLLSFKHEVLHDVQRHNVRCRGKVSLFDFLTLNDLTRETIGPAGSNSYIDLIHFRPPIGVRLARRMLGNNDLGIDLTAAHDPDNEIDRLKNDVAAWRAAHPEIQPSGVAPRPEADKED
ncbi:MAG TPA: hypothetical protein VGG10_02640 [Rhizomicrobium sp.]|jgi:hypothetical protein